MLTDSKTLPLLPECDLAGPGRAPEPAPHLSKAAIRAALYRARNRVKPVTVNIPEDIAIAFEAYCIARGKKKADVIAKLIETQLLRKR